MGVDGTDDARIRAAMFVHLDALVAQSPDGTLRSSEINTFTFEGRSLRLVVQSGIWKPAGMSAALTIRTTYPRPDRPAPYEDAIAADGLLRYKYRGTDPSHSDNRALHEALEAQTPLAYFVGVDQGCYLPRYPVWIKAEDPRRLEFAVSLDGIHQDVGSEIVDFSARRYAERLTRARLHQPVFRARVLRAYRDQCAVCRLRQPRLLDAAHIIPDGQPRGEAVVPNGLSLCKIHHAAYDADLMAVRPDLVVEVAPQLLRERDGPMLLHGLQEMDGRRIEVPAQRRARPDPERLDDRYRRFRAAG
ncbi:MAG: HNH endonuclease [Acidimicrobiales bacterium]